MIRGDINVDQGMCAFLYSFIVLLVSDMGKASSAANCHIESKKYNISNGCNTFTNYRFVEPCDKHDVCYLCAEEQSGSRLMCDILFLRNMKTICAGISWLEKPLCHLMSHSYYWAVRTFGSPFYVQENTDIRCSNSWVQECINT